MITFGFQKAPTGHCIRELVTPTRPGTVFSELRAYCLILAPWTVFGLAMVFFG